MSNHDIECYMENVVINRNDLYINFDKFTSGKSNIILITGFSGSGKTTLAKKIASEYKCDDYIELDCLDWWFSKSITIDKLKEGIPACYDFLMSHKKYLEMEKRPKLEELGRIYEEFIPYVISWCKKRTPKKYVIEGIQLYERYHKGDKFPYSGYPMVLKGTSGLKSCYQACKRDNMGIKDVPEYLDWMFRDNKQIEALYKAMKEEYDKEESVMESSNDPILSYLEKYGDSTMYVESGNTKTRYNDKGEKIPDKCTKCGGDIGIFIQGEPVYLCVDCKKYFGTVPFSTPKKKKDKNVNESYEEDYSDELFLEAALKDTTILKDELYPNIEACLSNTANVRKLKKIISDFIEKNTEKLTTPGPQYLIVFGDQDKELYYDLFKIEKNDVVKAMKNVVKQTGSNSDFKYLLGNPFLALMYYIIRYFTYHKDVKVLNACLGMFAIDVYWSIFTKYFPNGIIEPVMNYTIDNLTDKFIIKKAGTIFGALTESARRSYGFHEQKIKDGRDADCVSFMQRIRNDQNSMFRTLSTIYYKNHKEGNAIATRNDDYDPSNPILDDVHTASTEIQAIVDKSCMPMISNGIDIALAEAASRMSNISISNLRIYLSKIFVNERLEEITTLVESMIFLYINESKRSVRDIKSQYFLYWAGALFKKTNSKDGNVVRINKILDKWGTETGIYEAFRSEGSRINYKKAIFLYIAMSVQKYT